MGEDVKQIQSVSDRPISMWIGEKLMAMGKLRAPDIAVAADYVRDLRVIRYQKTITAEPAMATIYADVIAKIQCTPVSLGEVLDDWNGRIKLVQLSLARAGTPIAEAQVGTLLDAAQDDFFLSLCELCGLKRKDETKNPTPPDASK